MTAPAPTPAPASNAPADDPPPIPKPQANGASIECDLWGAVLISQHAEGDSPIYVAAATETTMGSGSLEGFQKRLPDLKAETFEAYAKANAASHKVDCGDAEPAGHKVIVGKHAPGRGSTWALSSAGVDASGTQALLYAGYACGPLCGGGTLYLLEKQNGSWTVKEQTMVWIS